MSKHGALTDPAAAAASLGMVVHRAGVPDHEIGSFAPPRTKLTIVQTNFASMLADALDRGGAK